MQIRLFFSLFILIFIVNGCKKDDITPKTITISDFSIDMDENPENGQILGTVDARTNTGKIKFSLRSELILGAIKIDERTGVLSVLDHTLFDFETHPIISGVIVARNGSVVKESKYKIHIKDIFEIKTFVGTIRLRTQEEVDIFGDKQYEIVKGSVSIGSYYSDSTSIQDLSKLISLKRVEGKLDITNNSELKNLEGLDSLEHVRELYIANNSQLINFKELNHVNSVDTILIISNKNLLKIECFTSMHSLGKLFIQFNDKLHNITGFRNIERVEKLSVYQNNSLLGLAGLESLKTVKSLSIVNNENLLNILGLHNLTMTDYISIHGNPMLTTVDGLENLQRVDSTLRIITSVGLLNVDALLNLKYVGKEFSIYNNRFLKNYDGLSSLTHIGGDLKIFLNNEMANIDGLSNLTYVGGNLSIATNNNLKHLDGLSNLEYIGGVLTIAENAHLNNFCGLQKVIDNDNFESLVLKNNKYNPTLEDLKAGKCSE